VLTANGTRIQALLVDDDEEFCNLLKELLEPCGVDIKAVTDPVEALEIFTREKDNFHLVLLDYYMPHLNGTQMWGRLKELNPNVKVILVSAVDEFRLKQILAQCPMDGYIRKPFRIRVAIEVIRHVMTQTGQSLLPTELPTAFKSNVIGDGRRAGNGRGCG
jgi:CheY-like chemotaxis protein